LTDLRGDRPHRRHSQRLAPSSASSPRCAKWRPVARCCAAWVTLWVTAVDRGARRTSPRERCPTITSRWLTGPRCC